MKLKCLFCSIVAICIVLALYTTGHSEVYQYTDENGILRFTDDTSNIPEDKLPKVETFESLKKPDPARRTERGLQESSTRPDTSTWSGQIRSEAKELEATRENLQREYKALQDQKKALGDPPPEHAKSTEKADYIYQVTELNRKIEQYKKRSEEFKKKYEAFNKKVGRK